MSETPARKSSQVSTTVSPEVFEALEDHRWTVRKKMTEVVAEAVQDYMGKHGIKTGQEPKTGTDKAADRPTAKA